VVRSKAGWTIIAFTMRLPLFGKILVATLVPLTAFAALGMTANQLAHRAHRVARQAHYLARHEAEAELGRRLVATAQATAALLRAEDTTLLQPGDEQSRTYRRIQAELRRVARRTESRRIYIVDRGGRSLCDTRAGVAIGTRYYHLDVERALLARVFRDQLSGSSMLFRGKDGVDYKAGFAPLVDVRQRYGAQREGPRARRMQGKVVAALAVEGAAATFRSLRRLDAQLRGLRAGLLAPWHVALMVAVGLVLLVAASLLLARSVTRPVRYLMQAAAAIGRGELDDPVTPRSHDELGVLAEAMDQMRADLLARQRELQLMLSGIAHEVRNPLGGMALFAGLLADELGDDPERGPMVERIKKELEALDRVVNEFLDFARDVPLAEEDVDLVALTREAMEMCRPGAEERDVSLQWRSPEEEVAGTNDVSTPSEVATVRGDRDKLRRVLLNVIQNAVQACRPGDTVTLTAVKAAAGDSPGGEAHHVVVCRDTGAGIPPEALERIFDAFFTTREKGTGLGLALAQKIVAAHRGRIEVRSTLHEGTEVRILLPARLASTGE